jgi:hypothetical protein
VAQFDQGIAKTRRAICTRPHVAAEPAGSFVEWNAEKRAVCQRKVPP